MILKNSLRLCFSPWRGTDTQSKRKKNESIGYKYKLNLFFHRAFELFYDALNLFAFFLCSQNTKAVSTTLFFFFFWPHHGACGILVPRPRVEPEPPAVEAWSLNHWTAREVPAQYIFKTANFSFMVQLVIVREKKAGS